MLTENQSHRTQDQRLGGRDPTNCEDAEQAAFRFEGEGRNRAPSGIDDVQIVPDFIEDSRGLGHYLKPLFHPGLLAILLAITGLAGCGRSNGNDNRRDISICSQGSLH